jgi:hypothetical protein
MSIQSLRMRGLIGVLVSWIAVVSQARAADTAILGKLPEDFVVYAVGTYGGTRMIDAQIDKSGHEAGQVDVVVNVPDRPVLLVLTAYDPVVWRVGRTPESKVVGVIASGYHTQLVGGIDKDTPRAISTYESPGKFDFFYASGASPELLEMNERVKELTGKEIERFIHKPQGPAQERVFYVGEPPKEAAKLVYQDEVDLAPFKDPNRPAAGQRGIDQLIAAGKLRRATQEDIEGWVEKASEKYKRLSPDLKVDHHMRAFRTYVVLKPLELPDGMYGAHSAAFIVPQGVEMPTGPVGHNEFYLMDGTKQDAFTRAFDRKR